MKQPVIFDTTADCIVIRTILPASASKYAFNRENRTANKVSRLPKSAGEARYDKSPVSDVYHS